MGMTAGLMLAAATLLSEDAATLAAGALVAAQNMSATNAVAWVALGIWLGDVGLFAIGRLARRLPPVARWVDRRWTLDQVKSMEARLSRGVPLAIAGSRFLPGTRVALYVTAGVLNVRIATFALAAGAASVVWTTVVVTAVGSLGPLW